MEGKEKTKKESGQVGAGRGERVSWFDLYFGLIPGREPITTEINLLWVGGVSFLLLLLLLLEFIKKRGGEGGKKDKV